MYTNRKVNSRGGVAIYIKDNIKFSNRPDLEINHDGEFESIVIEANVSYNTSSVIVGEIYRVPNTSEVVSVERYEEIINRVTSTDKDLILFTDQNFDYFKMDTHKHSLEQRFVSGWRSPSKRFVLVSILSLMMFTIFMRRKESSSRSDISNS